MKCCSTFLLYLVLCHGIFLGFHSIYIDTEKGLVKTYSFVKMFVYLQNCLYCGLMSYNFIDYLEFDINNPVISFPFLATQLARLSLFVAVVLLRLKGDKALKDWLEIILRLQKTYFERLDRLAPDRRIKSALIINVCIVTSTSLIFLLNAICTLVKGEWLNTIDIYLQNYLIAMQHYIMLHHGLILSYITYCFQQLNFQLSNGRVEPPFAHIYYQLSKLLQQVNDIYGPAIFCILFGLLVTNALISYGLIMYLNIESFKLFIVEYLLTLSAFVFLCVDMYLYFLICNRVFETTEEMKEIILDYSEITPNQEVCYLME